MIILFTYNNDSWLDLANFLIENWNQQFIILNEFNKYYFIEAKCIIPLGIKAQKELNKYPKYKHKFLVCCNDVYEKLNNKIKFYYLIEKYKLLKNSDVKLIKTYDQNYKGPNINKKFIIKHKHGIGSYKNKIIKGYIYDLIKKYSNTHQIQDILDIHYINGINGVSCDGKIMYMLNFKTPGFIENDYYGSDNIQYMDSVDPKLGKVVTDIIQKIKYNGFFEFEFIVDKKKNIYLMECNPRISGNLKCKMEEDECPYINNFIIPYYNKITNSHIEFTNYTDKYTVTYCGSLGTPNNTLCSCGCGIVLIN